MEVCNELGIKNQFLNCAICGVAANNKCAACSLVVYCSKKHQKAHWKKHKNECTPYEVIKKLLLILSV